ncbi:MAG TPA: glycosyltransferase [Thermomonas sp.]|nr:glycosyltransferase [Thermomonas sp.]
MLRFLPLYLAMRAAGVAAALPPKPRWKPVLRTRWQPGISVIVPERGTPDLLADTLAHLALALRAIDESQQVIVVVNGAAASMYADLQAAHPGFEWHFHAQPLGYNGAISAGLRSARHDWVYLLNSDMRLAPDALSTLLRWRQNGVFALASQIHFADPARRREETGWSDVRIHEAGVEMFERTPPASLFPRGSLYAGGGASLFRRDLLRRYAADSAVYNPFYWEDAEWGARAWADGWEVLFCPRSNAVHQHRGTVNRFHANDEVERVFARNGLQFELRQHWTRLTSRTSLGVIGWLADRSQRELASLTTAWGVLRRRHAARRTRDRGIDFATRTHRWYPQPLRPGFPRLLLVTPFAIDPPSHGGARRVVELARRLATEYDVILLSDECSGYRDDADGWSEGLASVHLVEGRGDQPGQAAQDLQTRLRRHVHERLRDEARRLIAVYEPDLVQVEFMELAGLAELRQGDARWCIDLHDVYLDGGDDDALQRSLLARYDVLCACSGEDVAQLADPRALLVRNGATDRLASARPSRGACVLFMGPFRYAPNREGIEAFLREAWPRLRERVPGATLVILGGSESSAHHYDPLYRSAGVQLIDRYVDPAPWLDACAITINPQRGIRGSAVKVAESLLAARCCVSTAEGGRGFAGLDAPGLRLVEGVAAMADAAAELLLATDDRHARERPAPELARALGWQGAAEHLLARYRDLRGKQGK